MLGREEKTFSDYGLSVCNCLYLSDFVSIYRGALPASYPSRTVVVESFLAYQHACEYWGVRSRVGCSRRDLPLSHRHAKDTRHVDKRLLMVKTLNGTRYGQSLFCLTNSFEAIAADVRQMILMHRNT